MKAPRKFDHPMLFSAPMIRALIEGRKTQTRRVLNNVPRRVADTIHATNIRWQRLRAAPYLDAYCSERKSAANPRGMGDTWCWWTRDSRVGSSFKVGYVPGDCLWVREAFARVGDADDDAHACWDMRRPYYFRADSLVPEQGKWRSPIHMPREASRLTLTITGVRVERLNDISESDAEAEGIEPQPYHPGRWTFGDGISYPSAGGAYATLWDHLHGPGAWDANPWVAALTFTVGQRNIDETRIAE